MNPQRIIATPGCARPIGHVGGVVARAGAGRELPPLTAVAAASLMHDEALVEIELAAVVDDDA